MLRLLRVVCGAAQDGQLGQAMEASGLAFLAQEAAQEINIQLKNSRLAYKMKLKA